MRTAVLDTGPIVAWLCPKDAHHTWARRAFAQIAPGSLICEAVITEVCHLAAKEGIASAKVISFIERARLTPVPLSNELAAIRKLLERYADAPMDFADACVVRLAEMNGALQVCTIDAQFQFFRKNERESITLIAPFA